CTRMASASMPPRMKKNIAAAPYMMPIRLWSTVVTQDRQPVVAFGRVNTPRGLRSSVVTGGRVRASVGRSTMAMSALLQRLEVGDERIDLRVAEVQVRHAAPVVGGHRLLPGRVLQPCLEVGVVHLLADL